MSFQVNVKFNNGSTSVFNYSEKPNVRTVISSIGSHLYTDKYNNKVDEYIKIIHMGKILPINDEINFEPDKNDISFHCVVKKIPDEVFIIQKSPIVEPELVNTLITNPRFIKLLSQRTFFEFIQSNLDNPNKIIDLVSGKFTQPTQNETNLQRVKYSSQLEILKDMGFSDENELIGILVNTKGNIENAINILMS